MGLRPFRQARIVRAEGVTGEGVLRRPLRQREKECEIGGGIAQRGIAEIDDPQFSGALVQQHMVIVDVAVNHAFGMGLGLRIGGIETVDPAHQSPAKLMGKWSTLPLEIGSGELALSADVARSDATEHFGGGKTVQGA